MRKFLSKGVVASSVVGLALCVCGLAAAANEFRITAIGSKQARFKLDTATATYGVAYYHEVSSPRDAATGQASGKRQHSPITITKAWGASSPQFYQALVTNEILTTVLFEFPSATTGEIYETVKLTTATVSSIRRRADPLVGQVEDISFTYQKFELEDKVGQTMMQDDWYVAL